MQINTDHPRTSQVQRLTRGHDPGVVAQHRDQITNLAAPVTMVAVFGQVVADGREDNVLPRHRTLRGGVGWGAAQAATASMLARTRGSRLAMT